MYVMFTARKLLLTSRVNQLQSKLLEITRKRMDLLSFSGLIASGEYSPTQMIGQTSGVREKFMNWYQLDREILVKQEDGSIQYAPIVDMAVVYRDNVLAQELERGNDYSNDEEYQNRLFQACLSDLFKDAAQEENDKITKEEKYLEQEQKLIESQLNAAMKELEEVEKAEEKGIESSTPKYCGGK